MTYDADNELKTVDGYNVAMDNDGNLLSGPLTNDTFAAYSYDARNRLSNVGGVTNYYDAANNRIGQAYGTNSVEYVINPNTKLPQVLERIKNGVTTYYIYGPGLLYQITEAPTGTNTVTYHYDSRGSTIALTGDNGLVTDRMEYSLYATMTYHAGTNDTPFLFNGRGGVMSDPNGLLYMRARYYNPFLCRFLNPDPSGFSAGMNFYTYANGNPASLTDPGGLDASSITANGDTITGPAPATPLDLSNPFGLDATENDWSALTSVDDNSPSTWDLFGNGLNNTVSAIGQSMGLGLYDASTLQWSQSQWDQISDEMYSVNTPENPAATPYIEATLGTTIGVESVLGGGAVAFWAPGTSIFYSGAESTAITMSEAGEGSTIYDTLGGQALRYFGVQNQTAWQTASWFYANTAGSQAIVVIGAEGGSTLGTIEIPILVQNGVQLSVYTVGF